MDEPGPRVLVVDDDRAIRRFLDSALRTRGYAVFEAASARAAVATASSVRPDVVILDLGLPDGDGIEVMRQLRQVERIPILILSLRDQEDEKVAALEAGADDYITKPFGIAELHARLRVLLRRRAGSPTGEPYRSGDLEVDLSRRLVKKAGEVVKLTPTEYDLLKALVQAGGKVLTRQRLLEQVWGPAYLTASHMLHVNISNLRSKIERDPTQPEYILTEPRVGYRLQAEE
ncbi:MAG TPA: response regulator [bacterium]|nr:response regulator [bacterium]